MDNFHFQGSTSSPRHEYMLSRRWIHKYIQIKGETIINTNFLCLYKPKLPLILQCQPKMEFFIPLIKYLVEVECFMMSNHFELFLFVYIWSVCTDISIDMGKGQPKNLINFRLVARFFFFSFFFFLLDSRSFIPQEGKKIKNKKRAR